jgi:hypothetical protein
MIVKSLLFENKFIPINFISKKITLSWCLPIYIIVNVILENPNQFVVV